MSWWTKARDFATGRSVFDAGKRTFDIAKGFISGPDQSGFKRMQEAYAKEKQLLEEKSAKLEAKRKADERRSMEKETRARQRAFRRGGSSSPSGYQDKLGS